MAGPLFNLETADGDSRCLAHASVASRNAFQGVWGIAVPRDLAPWCWPLGELEYLAASAFADQLRDDREADAGKLAGPVDDAIPA